MKKIFLFAFIFLAACTSAPQVTVTSEVTVTLPPSTEIPIPTLHPQFTALQEQIAASGERFFLSPEGLFDGANPVPGLTISPDGTMTIMVNGEPVILDPTKTHFDDEDGIINDEYKLDESGNWVPATETVTIKNSSGVGFVLGTQIEGQPDGVKIVTDIVPPDALDSKEKALFEIRTNPEKIGFAEGETQLVYVPTEDGKFRIELQRTSNPTDVIAVFGNDKFVWDWEKLLSEDGENVLFKGAIDLDRKDINSALSAQNNILIPAMRETGIFMGGTTYYDRRVMYSNGGKAIIIDFKQRGDNQNEGYVFIRGKDGKPIVLWVENFDLKLPSITQ